MLSEILSSQEFAGSLASSRAPHMMMASERQLHKPASTISSGPLTTRLSKATRGERSCQRQASQQAAVTVGEEEEEEEKKVAPVLTEQSKPRSHSRERLLPCEFEELKEPTPRFQEPRKAAAVR